MVEAVSSGAAKQAYIQSRSQSLLKSLTPLLLTDLRVHGRMRGSTITALAKEILEIEVQEGQVSGQENTG